MANLDGLADEIVRPGYDRNQRAAGIVHFGIGAFHRAHMAAYTDDAMAAGEGNWRIIGVSLRSASVSGQMNPQDGFYTLTERSAVGSKVRLIGSVREVIVALQDPEAVVAALAAPTTHIVSFTITEKGYCRAGDGSLDRNLNDEVSVYTYLAVAIRRRKEAGLPGLTLLSCDNLADNGAQLQRLMREYLEDNASDLTAWFESECRCPSTMVDRIVPATTDGDRAEIECLLGLRDEAAVVTEPFSQWVIEDNFAGPRPAWENHGVQIVADVHPFELAKLRMLNGSHSTIAYLGLYYGYETVDQAMADPRIADVVDALMQEAAATLPVIAGLDTAVYAEALKARFRNPALHHRLAQIAMDGSQKMPQRLFGVIVERHAAGAVSRAAATGVAAWLRHFSGPFVNDPLSELLRAAAHDDPEELVRRSVAIEPVFGQFGQFGKEGWFRDLLLEVMP